MATTATYTAPERKYEDVAPVVGTRQYQQQKSRIQEQEAKRRQRAQEALQRRLAGRGFTAGSGLLEKQQRLLGTEMYGQEAGRLTDVDIAQRQAQAAAMENWRARQAAAEEARLAREQEGTMAGYTAGLAEEAAQAGQQRQIELMGEEQTDALERMRQQQKFQTDFATLEDTLARGKMELSDVLAQNKEQRKVRLDALYQAGINNAPVPNIESLTQLERDAYQLGLQKRSTSDYQREIENAQAFQDAMVLYADDDDVRNKIRSIFGEFGIYSPEESREEIVASAQKEANEAAQQALDEALEKADAEIERIKSEAQAQVTAATERAEAAEERTGTVQEKMRQELQELQRQLQELSEGRTVSYTGRTASAPAPGKATKEWNTEGTTWGPSYQRTYGFKHGYPKKGEYVQVKGKRYYIVDNIARDPRTGAQYIKARDMRGNQIRIVPGGYRGTLSGYSGPILRS